MHSCVVKSEQPPGNPSPTQSGAGIRKFKPPSSEYTLASVTARHFRRTVLIEPEVEPAGASVSSRGACEFPLQPPGQLEKHLTCTRQRPPWSTGRGLTASGIGNFCRWGSLDLHNTSVRVGQYRHADPDDPADADRLPCILHGRSPSYWQRMKGACLRTAQPEHRRPLLNVRSHVRTREARALQRWHR